VKKPCDRVVVVDAADPVLLPSPPQSRRSLGAVPFQRASLGRERMLCESKKRPVPGVASQGPSVCSCRAVVLLCRPSYTPCRC